MNRKSIYITSMFIFLFLGSLMTTLNPNFYHNNLDSNINFNIDTLAIDNWENNGSTICIASNTQQDPQICSDGNGGVIIAWQDSRGGGSDIYAQRIDSEGDVQWTTNGIAICTATNGQQDAQICSDGTGGAIITWQDYRTDTGNIYAQRIDSEGNTLWTANGVAICTASDVQMTPQICSDGTGGAIITWRDYRSGTYSDIYAQRIDSAGNVQWTANGEEISKGTELKMVPQICSDNLGGAIITWQDYRTGTADIYAQRINMTGSTQWTANGTAICTATSYQQGPQLVPDGIGGAIITWEDSRGGTWDIYAQRINLTGNTQWTADGIAISTTTYNQQDPQLCSDGIGGAIITWEDNRTGSSLDIYAQRINPAGNTQWTANGIAICTTTGNQESIQLCSDGEGGAIITWQDYRGGANSDIYMQRINLIGSTQWTTNGAATCTASNNQISPQICSDSKGGAYISWQDSRSGPVTIYSQRVNGTSSTEWTSDGAKICLINYNQQDPQICNDGAGGAIITWEDSRSGSADIYAQRVINPSTTVLDLILPNPSTDGNITLQWINLDQIIEYYVYRNSSIINSIVGMTPITTVSINIFNENLTSNGTYYYVIVSNTLTGNSSISNCESVTIEIPSQPPTTPPPSTPPIPGFTTIFIILGLVSILSIFLLKQKKQII